MKKLIFIPSEIMAYFLRLNSIRASRSEKPVTFMNFISILFNHYIESKQLDLIDFDKNVKDKKK